MRRKPRCKNPVYIMMNKKAGTVCSTVSDRRHTVYEAFSSELLVSPEGAKLHTVGRLDADTEGLLLLTNDGQFSNFLTRPENQIEKKYFVRPRDSVTPEDQKQYTAQAQQGLELPAEKKAPVQYSSGALIEWNREKELFITVTEGKFHEVKRIFLALNNEVVFLKRVRTGSLVLDETLLPGQWRHLTEEEVKLLFQPSVP